MRSVWVFTVPSFVAASSAAALPLAPPTIPARGDGIYGILRVCVAYCSVVIQLNESA